MRQLSFLFVSFLLFISLPVESFTLVLKNGKAMEGRIIGESDATLQFKGPDGIVISVKKSIVDIEATSLRNQKTESQKIVAVQPVEALSLADLARQLKKQRTGRARVVTDRDMSGLPEVSIMGSIDPVTLSKPSSLSAVEDRYWRKEAEAIKKRLMSAQQEQERSASQCARARSKSIDQPVKRRKDQVIVLKGSNQPDECIEAQEKIKKLDELQQEWSEFQDRARHAGVSWQMID